MSSVQIRRDQDPNATRRILRSLPDWFGIEEAIETYVRDAERLTSYLAKLDDHTVAVALVDRPSFPGLPTH